MAGHEAPVLAAVLAGGRGSRMRGPKPTIRLGGRALIEHPLGALRDAGLQTVVVAKPDSRLPVLDVAVWQEPDEPVHPLCGVLRALDGAGAPAAGALLPRGGGSAWRGATAPRPAPGRGARARATAAGRGRAAALRGSRAPPVQRQRTGRPRAGAAPAGRLGLGRPRAVGLAVGGAMDLGLLAHLVGTRGALAGGVLSVLDQLALGLLEALGLAAAGLGHRLLRRVSLGGRAPPDSRRLGAGGLLLPAYQVVVAMFHDRAPTPAGWRGNRRRFSGDAGG